MMMAAWDCRITQVVDVNKGIHCFTAKGAKSCAQDRGFAGSGKQRPTS